MKKYGTVSVTVDRHEVLWTRCDGCGILEEETEFGRLTSVAIEVNHGEEYGRRDEYDYCDPCLLDRASALVAAGSRSAIVTGEDPPEDEEDDE